jgi:hypothetical protein
MRIRNPVGGVKVIGRHFIRGFDGNEGAGDFSVIREYRL